MGAPLRRARSPFAAAAAAAALLAVASSRPALAQQDVNVVNTPSVEVANPPALQRYQKRFSFLVSSNGWSGYATFVVPSDEVLVIEQVSVAASMPAGQTFYGRINTMVDGEWGTFDFPAAPAIVMSNGPHTRIATATTRIYADPGSTVWVWAVRNDYTGVAAVTFTVSGHLVDVP
jgi:hypothetical protein